MSTTNTITMTFTVDADEVMVGRMMDDLIHHIQSLPNTQDLKASHTREVQ